MGKTLIKMTPQLHNQWWSHQHGSSKLIWLSHMIGAWALIPTQCDLCLATSRPDEYMQMRKSAVNDAAALHFCRFVLHNGDSSTLIIITLKNMRFDVEEMEKMLMLKYQIIFLLPKNYIRLHTCGREVRENANYINWLLLKRSKVLHNEQIYFVPSHLHILLVACATNIFWLAANFIRCWYWWPRYILECSQILFFAYERNKNFEFQICVRLFSIHSQSFFSHGFCTRHTSVFDVWHWCCAMSLWTQRRCALITEL